MQHDNDVVHVKFTFQWCYLRVKLNLTPPPSEQDGNEIFMPLKLRMLIAESLTKLFGLCGGAGLPVDIVWMNSENGEALVRVHKDDGAKVTQALAMFETSISTKYKAAIAVVASGTHPMMLAKPYS